MEEATVVKTKGEALKDFVNKKYIIGKRFWEPYQENWKDIQSQYVGILDSTKEIWQGNVIVPTLKKVVRNLVAMYISILLSKGAESFDLEPGEEGDKKNAEILRHKIIYDLRTMEIEKKVMPILQNFILFGYAVGVVPWKHIEEKMRTGKKTIKNVVTFDGPDLECADLFNLFSDPNCKDLSSWKIYRKDNVPITYLKQKEEEKLVFNIDALKGTVYPGEQRDDVQKDTVETLEYHGLVPKKLIEGQIDEVAELNPFDDEYVQSIIVIANQQIVIRAGAYPYWCNDIFVPFVNDHMTDEIVGMGCGDDIKALAPMLTNLYNKLIDCVNIVTNPMYEMAVKRYLGRAKTILMRPGRILPVREIGVIREIDTTAQAASLRVLQDLIAMVEGIIEEITSTTPQIMPTGDKREVHTTARGLAMMTEKSMVPVNSKIKFCLEPGFRKILSIIYRHNIQHFKHEKAARILGEKKARELDITDIKKADIMMKGNPDFIPTGISGFMERQVEIQNLLDFMKISASATAPVMETDAFGNETPAFGPDGKPVMKPYVDLKEIIRRIAELFRFKDIEKLIPKEEEEKKARGRPERPALKAPPRAGSRPGMARQPTPAGSPGGYLARGGTRGMKGE